MKHLGTPEGLLQKQGNKNLQISSIRHLLRYLLEGFISSILS